MWTLTLCSEQLGNISLRGSLESAFAVPFQLSIVALVRTPATRSSSIPSTRSSSAAAGLGAVDCGGEQLELVRIDANGRAASIPALETTLRVRAELLADRARAYEPHARRDP